SARGPQTGAAAKGQQIMNRRAVRGLLLAAACVGVWADLDSRILHASASAAARRPAHAAVQTQSSTTASRNRDHVEALASDQLEGRLTGSNGERLAADYLVRQLERIGAKPLPGLADYRVPFEFTAGSRDGGSIVTVEPGTRTFDARTDVQALPFS